MKLINILREIQIKKAPTPEEVFDLWYYNSEKDFNEIDKKYLKAWKKSGRMGYDPKEYLKTLNHGELIKIYNTIKQLLT